MPENWRPENWDKENEPKICALRKVEMRQGYPNISLYWAKALIEAGADAILEALKVSGKYGAWYQTHEGDWQEIMPELVENGDIKGWQIFIKEEET